MLNMYVLFYFALFKLNLYINKVSQQFRFIAHACRHLTILPGDPSPANVLSGDLSRGIKPYVIAALEINILNAGPGTRNFN